MSLTTAEARFLLGVEKVFNNNEAILLGPAPMKWTREMTSTDNHHLFLLDYHRGTIRLEKFSSNNRYRTNIVLLRYCSAVRHTNPDGTTFSGPHVHIYQEGFDDKIAFPISEIGLLSETPTIEEVMMCFLGHINIQNCPTIQSSLV